jgi:hypothetical protein
MPAMTQAFGGGKVLASSNVARDIDRYDPGPPREGDGRAITTPVPIASRRMSGNSSAPWPTTKSGAMMYYGKGPR